MPKRRAIPHVVSILIWFGLVVTYIVTLVKSITTYSEYGSWLTDELNTVYIMLIVLMGVIIIAAGIGIVLLIMEKLGGYATTMDIYAVASMGVLFLSFWTSIGDLSYLPGGYWVALIATILFTFAAVFTQAHQFRMAGNSKHVGGAAFVPVGLYLAALVIRLAVFHTLGSVEGIIENVAWSLLLFTAGLYIYLREQDLGIVKGFYGYAGMQPVGGMAPGMQAGMQPVGGMPGAYRQMGSPIMQPMGGMAPQGMQPMGMAPGMQPMGGMTPGMQPMGGMTPGMQPMNGMAPQGKVPSPVASTVPKQKQSAGQKKMIVCSGCGTRIDASYGYCYKCGKIF